MSGDLTIEKADGGYIVETRYGKKVVVSDIEELFEYLLMMYEGRADTFTGASHGEVIVKRGNNDR